MIIKKKRQHSLTTKRFKTSLLTVSLAGVSLLLGTVTFIRAHSTTAKEACIKNLRAIDAANHGSPSERPTIYLQNIGQADTDAAVPPA